MAKVYISCKVQKLIEAYQHLLPNYEMVNEHKKIKEGYVVLLNDEVENYSFSIFNTVIVVGDQIHDFYNCIDNDPKAVAYLIQSLCCSKYESIQGKKFEIIYSESNDSPNIQFVNELNQYMNEGVLLNLNRFVFCSSLVTIVMLIYASSVNKSSLFSTQTYDTAMPLCVVTYIIYGLVLILNYYLEKHFLKKKCQLIKNKGNQKGLYYISNEIEKINIL